MNLSDVLPLSEGAVIVSGIITVVVGLLACFAGYRLVRILLALYGFAVGAILGYLVAGAFIAEQGLVRHVVALVAGLIGAGLMVALYHVGVFVVGAVAGALLAHLIGAILRLDMPAGGVLLGAVLAGIVALMLQRQFLILATAFSGGWAAIAGGAALLAGRAVAVGDVLRRPFSWQQSGVPTVLFVLLWLALACIGASVQFRTTGD